MKARVKDRINEYKRRTRAIRTRNGSARGGRGSD